MRTILFVFFCFMLIGESCKNIEVVPFEKFNVEIQTNMTEGQYKHDTLGDYYISLLKSKINDLPLYDSLPFNMKIGDDFNSVISKLNEQKIVIKKISEKEIITTNTIKTMYQFEIETYFTFQSSSKNKRVLNHVIQNIFINSSNYDLIWKSEDFWDYKKIMSINLSDEDNFKYNVFRLTDRFYSNYLLILQSKYGQPNYILSRLDSKEMVEKYRTFGQSWLKKGVLINSRQVLSYYDIYYGNNFKNIHIANIDFSRVKDYIDLYN